MGISLPTPFFTDWTVFYLVLTLLYTSAHQENFMTHLEKKSFSPALFERALLAGVLQRTFLRQARVLILMALRRLETAHHNSRFTRRHS